MKYGVLVMAAALLAASLAIADVGDGDCSGKEPWRNISLLGFDPGMYGSSCLGIRSECLDLAHRLYVACLENASGFWGYLSCENDYDWDQFGCGLEYDMCLVGRIFA